MPVSTDTLYTAVTDFEGLYSVNEQGDVFSHRAGRNLTPVYHTNGRPYVALCKDGAITVKAMYRIVAETFIPNPENKPHVNHLDGNVANSAKTNLEWATESENAQHAIAIGLRAIGVDSHNAKLSADQVIFCRSHYKSRDREFSFNGLARRFGVHPSTIQRVVQGERYKEV